MRSSALVASAVAIGTVAALLLSASGANAADLTKRRTCAGFPRLDVTTPPGFCVARVADRSDGLRFPRRIIEVAPGRYWITDMGSWEPNRGRLLELTLAATGAPGRRVQFKVLAEGLDRPHGLALGPDGRVYVGEAGRIWRTAVADVPAPQTVIDGLPSDGAHPLKEFVFGTAGRLYINVGSESGACGEDDGSHPLPCAETQGMRPRAVVLEATLGGDAMTLQSLRPFATGLRNSMALAFVPGPGVLLQGENSIDDVDADEPPEELNHLHDGKNYGWPACVGAQRAVRGYEGRVDCTSTEPPVMLWPAHMAPLHMLAFPPVGPTAQASPFTGQLLVAWHGYRPGRQGVVSFALDALGHVSGPAHEWMGGWQAKTRGAPQGAPTGLLLDAAGRLLVVEDRNRTVLMLVKDGARGSR